MEGSIQNKSRTDEIQWSFEELEWWLTSAPVLMMPDQTKPFQIESDTLKYASGAVLTQLDNNEDCHPVYFCQKPLMKLN